MTDAMKQGALRLLEEALDLGLHEKLTVVTDSGQSPRVIDAFVRAGLARQQPVRVVTFEPVAKGEEPPRTALTAMTESDAVVLIPTRSITFSDAVAEARAGGTRFLVCTGLNEGILAEIVPEVDYEEMHTLGTRLVHQFTEARTLRITSDAGTDLTMNIAGREPSFHGGRSYVPGGMDDIPGGLLGLAPVEADTQGTLVIDASILPDVGKIVAPITMQIENGHIVAIEGGRDAERFREWLSSFNDPGMFFLSEVGIGVNRACFVTGSVVAVDESVLGLLHVGVGTNHVFPGGQHRAAGHADAMFYDGTLWLDGQMIVERGRIL